ncbi:30S ribosomal protein S3 [Microgenomates group bacterium RIFCSPLOWO2_01_FULL_47_10]|nr:ribosomal protein S3 [uncultured bacterium]OGV92394.1 MAG: 30S ribosomal protein S3 [Microgenomates group bacterium RIFCSPLOWO2_01_FULL_47_10]
MGQKVHPFGFRLGPLYTWKSRWYSSVKNYGAQILEDYRLRTMLEEKLLSAGITNVEIERSINTIKIILLVSRPGVVIGRGGSNLEALKKTVEKSLGKTEDGKAKKIEIEVKEIKDPEIQAKLVLDKIIDQLEKRYPHRRAVSQAMSRVMSSGAKGIKVIFAGRIGGAEIGRTEKYEVGTVPTQTLRADIDYAERPALTKSGYVGVKVYIYRGEKINKV